MVTFRSLVEIRHVVPLRQVQSFWGCRAKLVSRMMPDKMVMPSAMTGVTMFQQLVQPEQMLQEIICP